MTDEGELQNGVHVFVAAFHVQKYSDKNYTHTASNPYNRSTTGGLNIYQFYKNVVL
jgi:hypothetical protein